MKRIVLTMMAVMALGTVAVAGDNVRLSVDIKGLGRRDTLCLSWGAINKNMNPFITLIDPQTDNVSIPLNEPRLLVMGVKGVDGGYELVAAPGEDIQIQGKLNIDDTGKKPRAEFRKMKVQGAQYQPVYEKVVADYILHLDSLDTDIDQDFKGIKKIIFWAKQKKDEQVIADMYQTREGQSYIDRISHNFKEKNDYLSLLVGSHTDSFLGPLLMIRFGGRLTADQQPLYEKLSPEAKLSYYGQEMRDEVAPLSLVGTMTQAVTVTDMRGNSTMLSFSNEDAKLTLVCFWASWCQPCMREMPSMIRLYEEMHPLGLEMVGICVDKDLIDGQETVDDWQMPWTNYMDADRQAITEYGVKYIPSGFVVDSQGTIVCEKLRGDDLLNFLRERLNE